MPENRKAENKGKWKRISSSRCVCRKRKKSIKDINRYLTTAATVLVRLIMDCVV